MVATKNIHNSCADHGWLVSEAKVLMKKDKAETFLNGRSSTIRRAGDHNYIVPYFSAYAFFRLETKCLSLFRQVCLDDFIAT